MREVKTYSEAFKRGIAGKAGQGVYTRRAGQAAGTASGGNETLTGLLRKYGREDLLPERVKAGTVSETGELKAARKEIRELKATPADAHTDWCSGSAFLDIACERPGTTAAELKKHAVTPAG